MQRTDGWLTRVLLHHVDQFERSRSIVEMLDHAHDGTTTFWPTFN